MFKRSILLIFILFCVHKAVSQDAFTSYFNSFHAFENPILLTLKNQNFTLWISGIPVGEQQAGGIAVKESQYQSFIESLKYAQQEYKIWREDIESGKKTKLNKSLRLFFNSDAFFKTDKWNYDHNLYLKFNLVAKSYKDSSAYYLIIGTGNLKSVNYGTIRSEGFEIVFSNEDEILQFMDSISIDKINAQITQMNGLNEKIKNKIIENRKHRINKRPWLSQIEYGIMGAYISTFNINTGFINPPITPSIKEEKTIIYDGLSGGLFGRVYFNKFLIQPEIMYSKSTGLNYFRFIDPTLNPIILQKSTTQKTLEVPLLAGYNIFNKNRFKMSVVAGPQFSFDLGSHSTITYYSTLGNYDLSSASELQHNFRLGFAAAAMFDYARFSLGVRYNYFTNKFETTFDSRLFDKMPISSLTFTVAWKLFEQVNI